LGTINWTSSSNITITSSNSSQATFVANSNSVSEEGWIQLELDNQVKLKEYFWLNKPKDPYYFAPILGTSSTGANALEFFEIPDVDGAESYTWVIPTGWSHHSVSNPTSNKILLRTGTQSGSVRVKANNGCGFTNYTSKYVEVASGSGCTAPVCYYRVSPNPASNNITVEKDKIKIKKDKKTDKIKGVEYRLLDSNNQEFRSGFVKDLKKIEVESLPRGIYFLLLTSDTESKTFRILLK
jgi:hypothetical protein